MEKVMREVQDTYIRDMLNKTLPKWYLDQLTISINDQVLATIWNQLEAEFGLSTVHGATGLVKEFMEELESDFKSIVEFLQRLRESGTELTAKQTNVLGKG
jgi:hypothetical protein